MVGKMNLKASIMRFGKKATSYPGKAGKWASGSWSKLTPPQKRVVAMGLVTAGVVSIAAVKYNRFAEIKAKWNALKSYQKIAIVAGAIAAGYGLARYYKGSPLTKHSFRGMGI